jgi:hypothetical protein
MDTWTLPMRARKDRSPLPRAPVFSGLLFVRIGNRLVFSEALRPRGKVRQP